MTADAFDIPVQFTEWERAARLALAVFDDDRGRYDQVLAEGYAIDEFPLIWTLVRNWVQALVALHGTADRARTYVEVILLGVIEHREELGEHTRDPE